MGPHTPTVDESYRRYVELLLHHSRLLTKRGDEDPEMEAVEEEMTRLWDHLDAVQRRSLSELGSHLNWIRNGGGSAPRCRGPEERACSARGTDGPTHFESGGSVGSADHQ